MRTTEEYIAMIPTEPPADTMERLQAMGYFTTGVMSCRSISRREAAEMTAPWPFGAQGDSFRGDFRKNENDRAALLWCSECDSEFLAEYLPGKRADNSWSSGKPGGVRLYVPEGRGTIEHRCGDKIVCPECTASCWLKSVNELHYGAGEQAFLTVPTVTQGCLVLTKWCIERHIYETTAYTTQNAIESYIVDGKRVVRLVQWRRFMGKLSRLAHWEQTKRLRDAMGCPLMYNADGEGPDLAGTALENSRLWEYMAQSYEKAWFYPVAYIRLYLKHPAVENLVAAGLGRLIGQGIDKEAQSRYGYSPTPLTGAPRLDWIDWKQKRPAQMLGLNKQQLQAIRGKEYEMEHIRFLQWHTGKISFADLCAALDAVGPRDAEAIAQSGQPLVRTVHYLEKQNQLFTYLDDYWRMAEACGMELEQPEVRWPKNLVQAHDRADMSLRAAKVDSKTRRAFAAMTARCAGLAWEHDGICIRPAASPEELIQEGNTLHHCVGGYSSQHAAGKIILFVRHARRPERSWYTLNIDVADKHQIQLHGYRNEMLPGGRRLQIPQEVLVFVAEWRRTVLNSWRLPPEKKAGGRTDKQNKKATADTSAA